MDDIEVYINEYTRKDFFDEIFLKYPELEIQLINDFKRYKSTGELPIYFGRDAPYIRPYSAEKACLMHIHLKIPPDSFPRDRVQYFRTHKQGDPEKDICLVYVQGLIEDHRYSLLAIIHPNAHEKARNYQLMDRLAQVAQKFRDNN